MINKLNEIVTQNISQMECEIKEFVKQAVELEQQEELTVNSIEKLGMKLIKGFIHIVLMMMGSMLSNMVTDNSEVYCKCGKKMVSGKRNAHTRILSALGHIPITRDTVFCRRCHKGHGVLDEEIEVYGEHRVTKAMTETIAYVAQLVPSFERASEAINKLLKIEISPTQIQIISEEVGKEVFKREMSQAEEANVDATDFSKYLMMIYVKILSILSMDINS